MLSLAFFGSGLFFRGQRQIAIFLTCMGMIVLGGVRYQFAVPVINTHHIAFYNDNLTVNIKGTVIDEPDIRDRFVQLRVRVESISLPDEEATAVSGIILVQAFRYPEIGYGDALVINGRLSTPPDDGEFNYRTYLAQQGIHSIVTFPDIQIVAENQANPVRAKILDVKNTARGTINRSIADPQAALLIGILLGDDNGLPEQLNNDFQITGMTHIIAISGFNISIIIWVLLAMGRPFLSLKGTAIFAAVGISLYTVLVGADPSVVRAALMGGLYLFVGYWLGRPTFAIASLLWAAFLITLHDPLALWHVGFQLSFAATLSLMLFAKPATDWVSGRVALIFEREISEKVMGIITESVIITLTAQILTLPLIMLTFGQLSLVSLAANALILPAQPGVMLWGGLATLVGLIFPQVGIILGWLAWLFLSYSIYWVELLAKVSFASVAIEFGPMQAILTYALIAALFWILSQPRKKRRAFFKWVQNNGVQRSVTGTAVLATFVIFNWGYSQPDGRLHIYFLNVGQGDATLILTPSGRTILVDGGFYPSILNAELGKHLPFWQKRIDIMVATHPDADHVSGLVDVFDRYQVDMLVTEGSERGETAVYDAVLTAAENEKTLIKTAVVGEQIMIGDGVTLQILHPNENRNEENRNENSVAMRLTYGDFAYLFTGDAEVFAERTMLQTGLPLQATVFKAGHHGSRTSSTEPFLTAV
ncbi:MAG: DNA internalization-related competence protein ComEC/Rec2, partial [Chloroflexota bacterium]